MVDYNCITDYQIEIITQGLKEHKTLYQIAVEADVTKQVVESYAAKWRDLLRWYAELGVKTNDN